MKATSLIQVLPLAFSVAISAGCTAGTRDLTRNAPPSEAATPAADATEVDGILAEWGPRPTLAARQMMSKYGVPTEISAERLIWCDKGPYVRIEVTRREDPHDFPKPHMDYLEHTIRYQVPVDKTELLLAYDGSVTIDRTVGELSARCDLEGHNVLTLNLAHDIVTGKKNAQEARRAFGENVVQDALGKHPPYVTALQFEPSATSVADADEPIIPGSPVRQQSGRGEVANAQSVMSDAEILGFLVAINDNEILAASEAAKKQISPQVREYAQMLHREHGKNLDETLKLGMRTRVTPVETGAVDALRVKGAADLAALVPLEGKEFEAAYLAAMIKGHTEALAMIDRFASTTANDEVEAHLTTTRSHVAAHLATAKRLEGEARQGA